MNLKQGDLKPHLSATLSGGPDDWTDATAQISIKSPDTTVSTHDATIDTDEKTVEYDWTGFSTATAGAYRYEWIITFPDGDEMTAPAKSYFEFIINGRL